MPTSGVSLYMFCWVGGGRLYIVERGLGLLTILKKILFVGGFGGKKGLD